MEATVHPPSPGGQRPPRAGDGEGQPFPVPVRLLQTRGPSARVNAGMQPTSQPPTRSLNLQMEILP